jgi:hypothetical protein
MGGAGAEDAITPASRGVRERVASLRSYDWNSSGAATRSALTLATARPKESTRGSSAIVEQPVTECGRKRVLVRMSFGPALF